MDPHRRQKGTHRGSGVHRSWLTALDQLATLILFLDCFLVSVPPLGETESGSAGTQPDKG
jgi:hypothetical protein